MAKIITKGATFVVEPKELLPNTAWLKVLVGLCYHVNSRQLELYLPVDHIYIRLDEFHEFLEPARAYLTNPPTTITDKERLANKFFFSPMEPSFGMKLVHFPHDHIHYRQYIMIEYTLWLNRLNDDYGSTTYSCTITIEEILAFLATLEQELEPFKHAIKAP